MSQRHYVRLPIKGAYNIRDLGGYACENGGITRWNTLLRADDLSRLSQGEIDFLRDYGLCCDIDLRSAEECALQPDALCGTVGIAYHSIPLMTNVITDSGAYQDLGGLGQMYIRLIDNAQAGLRAVLQRVIAAPGGVLFHCSAGKDRTGVVAMLLLGAAGVARCDIVGNYQTTYTYIRQNPDFQQYAVQPYLPMLQSAPEYIEAALDHIDKAWGDIPRFLLAIGLTLDELAALRKKIRA